MVFFLCFMQYRLLLHTKLNVLSYHKAILDTRLEQLQELNSLGLKIEERTKDEIIDALDAAVLHLCQMADTALNTATLKVWKVNEVSHGNVDALVRWITRLSLKVRRIQDVYASPIGITVSGNGRWTVYFELVWLHLQTFLSSLPFFAFPLSNSIKFFSVELAKGGGALEVIETVFT
uniref:Uncharacterized protein n=1 Tax=Echinococcus granulosus TaxID=6210 RepID=U6FVE7_ECHGR|nr:hypothetical protein EgrG_002006200 [Echinococcus granulosus]